MPAPCTYKKYPLGDGFVLHVSEGDDETLTFTNCWGPSSRTTGGLMKPRSRFEVHLHGAGAEIALKGASGYIPVPLYVGLIIAMEWRIKPKKHASYLQSVARHAAGDIDAQRVSA